ncbi:MAG: hypothetical protein LUC24_07395 [Bacteroidales bacterium]|nr:hypothetical protein [Bacteroidales bacterium]
MTNKRLLLLSTLAAASAMAIIPATSALAAGSGTEEDPYTGSVSNFSGFSADAGTTVYVSGLTGWLPNGTYTYDCNINIGTDGFSITDGYSSQIYTFTGSISGSGSWDAYKSSGVAYHFIFTGDLSDYSGTLSIRSGDVSYLYFGNGGTAATDTGISGTGSVSSYAAIKYNYSGYASEGSTTLTVDNNTVSAKNLEFAGSVNYTVGSNLTGYDTTASNNTLTISNAGTTTINGSVSGFGNIVVAEGSTLGLNSSVELYSAISNSGTVSLGENVVFDIDNLSSSSGSAEYVLVSGGTVNGSLSSSNVTYSGSSLRDGAFSTSDDGAFVYTITTSLDLTWAGDSGATWNTQLGNAVWTADGETASGFVNGDSVTFGASGDSTDSTTKVKLESGAALTVGTMTVAGGAYELDLTSGSSTITGTTLTVASGATLHVGDSDNRTIDLHFDEIKLGGRIEYQDGATTWSSLEFTTDGATLQLVDLSGDGLAITNTKVSANANVAATWGGTLSLGALSGSGNLSLTGTTYTEGMYFTVSDISEYSGTLSVERASGGGATYLTLTGNNSNTTGNATINIGSDVTFAVGDDSNATFALNLDEAATMTVASGSSITLVGTSTIAGIATIAGSLSVASDATLDISGATIELATAIQNSGTVTVDASTVFIIDDSMSYTGDWATSATFTLVSGGTTTGFENLTIDNFSSNEISRTTTISISGATVTFSGADLVWAGTADSSSWNADVEDNTIWTVGEGGSADYFHANDSVAFSSSAENKSVSVDGAVTAENVHVYADYTFAITEGNSLTASYLNVDSGSLSVSGAGSLTATTLTINSEATAAFSGDSGLTVSISDLEGSGTLSLTDVSVSTQGDFTGSLALSGSSTTLTFTRPTKDPMSLEALSLTNGATFLVNNRGNNNGDENSALTIGQVTVDGSGTISTTYFQGYFVLNALSGTNATLNLTSEAASSVCAIYELGASVSASATNDFTGTIDISDTASGNRRSVSLVISNADIAKGAVINFGTEKSSDGTLSLGVNADSVTVAGLSSASNHGGTDMIYSGKISPMDVGANGANITSDDTARTLVINVANGESYDFYGTILNNVNLTKTGEGSQAIHGDSESFDGSVAVEAGTLTLDGAFAISSASVSSGATLSVSGNSTISGALSGAGSLTVSGEDVAVEIGSMSSYTGTLTVGDGTNASSVKLVGSNAYDNSSTTIVVNAGSTLDLNGNSETTFALTLAGGTLTSASTTNGDSPRTAKQLPTITLTADSTVNAESGVTFGMLAGNYGESDIYLGGNTLTKTGDGTFFLLDTSVYNSTDKDSTAAGTIAVNAGTLELDGVTASAATITVASGAALDVGKSDNYGASTIGTLTNAGTVTVESAGSLTIAGDSTSTGTLTSSGTLSIADGATLNVSGTTTISGTLAISGTLEVSGGKTTVSVASQDGGNILIDGGQLEVGESVTLTNTITVVLDYYLASEIATASTEGDTTSYAIVLNEGASVDGATIVVTASETFLSGLDADGSYVFDIVSGSYSGTYDYSELESAGYSVTSDGGVITIAAAPEPSMFGLLAGLGALGLVAARRRRNRKA